MNHRFIVEIFREVAGLGQKGRAVKKLILQQKYVYNFNYNYRAVMNVINKFL